MTTGPVALDELLEAQKALIAAIIGDMPEAHRDFLMGFKQGAPDWSLLGVPEAAGLPAVRWKQLNLDKLSANTRDKMVRQLKTLLDRNT